MCGSRDDFAVDKAFENWNNCDNQLIYFPKLKKFIAPTSIEMRYPLFNPSWIGTNGIYCKGTVIGNFTDRHSRYKTHYRRRVYAKQ